MSTQLSERQEQEIAIAARAPEDVISAAIGVPMYSANHRFEDLRTLMIGAVRTSSTALAVSRFYFSASPPVVVDVIEHPKRFEPEITAKRAYCSSHGIRYVLVEDSFDDDGVREQLRPAPAPIRRGKPQAPPRAAGSPAKPQRPRTRRTTQPR
jgi:hypothetical protein